jgi:hypothetical protein
VFDRPKSKHRLECEAHVHNLNPPNNNQAGRTILFSIGSSYSAASTSLKRGKCVLRNGTDGVTERTRRSTWRFFPEPIPQLSKLPA